MKKIIKICSLISLIVTINSFGQNTSNSLSVEPGIVYLNYTGLEAGYNYYDVEARVFSLSLYYSKNWTLKENIEYRLKPGILLASYPNGLSVQLANCIRYWINDKYNLNLEVNTEYHSYEFGIKSFTFTYGLGFAFKISNSLFIVPAIHKPFNSDYGMRSKSNYFINWHLKLGLEVNY